MIVWLLTTHHMLNWAKWWVNKFNENKRGSRAYWSITVCCTDLAEENAVKPMPMDGESRVRAYSYRYEWSCYTISLVTVFLLFHTGYKMVNVWF